MPKSRLTQNNIDELRKIVGLENVLTDSKACINHSLGKSFIDLMKLRSETLSEVTDAVIFPSTESEMIALLQYCSKNKTSIVPFGGGSSVLGGISPEKTQNQAATITINLQKMNKILEIDSYSHTMTAQSGILGPDLEKGLGEKGFTLGHFPQSFEYSTLGGWIATAGAGHSSNLYGRIENMVIALKVITPAGVIETKKFPASSTGPDIKHLFIGSEGCFGIIIEATLKTHPLPEKKTFKTFLIKNLKEGKDGIEILRELKTGQITPSIVRLSDPAETRYILDMVGLSLFKKKMLSFLLKVKNWRSFAIAQDDKKRAQDDKKRAQDDNDMCLLILGLEGTNEEVRILEKKISRLTKKHLSLGAKPGWKWLKHYFESPSLRDELIEKGTMVDTLETATTWVHLDKLYQATKEAFMKASDSKATVLCHISHIYLTGASLYFTWLCPMEKDPISQWYRIKKEVTQKILESGGTLSHHHGIGRDHKEWLLQEKGALYLETMEKLKKIFDPQEILNPGKLF